MSKTLFGTDGVRGVANQDLSPELALALGRVAAAFAVERDGRPRILLGRDTRLSSTMLESAFAAGCCSSGCEVFQAGVIPTGTLARFVREDGYSMGAMVSASHNPAEDNGIKLIGSDGRKLPDELELEFEKRLHAEGAPRAEPHAIGTVSALDGLLERHIEWTRSVFPARLHGLRVLVDCAHGAATEWARPVLEAAGAEVVELGVQPNGLNINAEGGATKPEYLLRATLEAKAQVGLAFDGDADRVVLADEKGRLVNGDHILALWALHRKRLGTLHPPIVVGTVMSNMGMERLLADHGVHLDRAPVGDRYVVERMDATGALAGGEQSGHIVFREKAPTGDGIVTALEVLQVIAQTGKALAELADLYEAWPQVLINVRVRNRSGWRTEAVERGIAEAERILGKEGRLVVRASGTQPILRVMCEHQDRNVRDSVAERILELLHDEAGGSVYSRVELTDALGD